MFYYQILIWTIHLTACRGGSLLDWSDKLLLLKGLMNTDAGRKMVEQRHSYLEDFLKEFQEETGGNH